MSAPEDRITDALRAGRISRFRAWWERRYCKHPRDSRTGSQKRSMTDGIDVWEVYVYKCKRCGSLMQESGYSDVPDRLLDR